MRKYYKRDGWKANGRRAGKAGRAFGDVPLLVQRKRVAMVKDNNAVWGPMVSDDVLYASVQ